MKKLLFAVAAVSAAVTFAGEFKTGFSRVDITPPLGVYMPGYYQVRYATEILDQLEINMLAFNDGKKTALIAQYDTEALSDLVADKCRDAIVKATGIERDAIMLHASHTHDGGYLVKKCENGSNGSNQTQSHLGPMDDLYINMVISRSADVAVQAIKDLKPSKFSCGRSVAKRISFGRRYLMKNGKVQTNPGTNNPDIVKPVDTADDTVQVLRIDREGGKPICVINFQTHPDVVGSTTITADWPGLTRPVFEAATFGEAYCMVINGTQGDVNHCNVMPLPGELNGLKRDFDAVDRGYAHAKHMANVLAGAALSVWMKCAPLETGDIRYACNIVKVPAQKDDVDPKKDLKWAEDVWALHEKAVAEKTVATDKDDVTVKYGWKDMELTTEVARAGRIIRMSKHDDFHDIPVWAIAFGDIAFSGFPAEPFNNYGVQIRNGSPFKFTMLSCLTNGSRGYFPMPDSYAQGGYESATSPFGKSVSADIIGGDLKLLKSLKD